ncbi:MAG: hypothetical protein IPL86_03245 [Flavobacteriales bacterium]|nr:hypothetical protein [Flavobacteriales bacterium]
MSNTERDTALSALQGLVQKFIEEAQDELRELWNALPVETSEKELYEVVGALMSRQSLLLRQLSLSSEFWNFDGGSLVLRSMVDTHITLAYICHEDSLKRALAFIDYGLGQERLYTAKVKAKAEADGNTDVVAELTAYESDLDSEKYIHHTDVKYGAWSDKNIKSLANEVGLRDYYEATFPPFSSGTHGIWNHLLKFNCSVSDNPLHAGLKIPKTKHPSPDVEILMLAAGQAEMSFRLVRKRFNIAEPQTSPAQSLDTGMNEITAKFNRSANQE